MLRWLRDIQWHKGRTLGPHPYYYITKAPIVTQSKRVAMLFKLDPTRDVWISNYDQMRSSAGEKVIIREEVIVQGKKAFIYKWNVMLKPVGLFLDECQSLKNPASLQGQIFNAYNDGYMDTVNFFKPVDGIGTIALSFSATPIGRVSDAQFIVVSCRIPIKRLFEI